MTDNNKENTKTEIKLETLSTQVGATNVLIEALKVNQVFLTEQHKSLERKIDKLTESLSNPAETSLGRELVGQINGLAARFDEIIKGQDKKIEEIQKIAQEVRDQSLRIQGALGLIKFVGFSALVMSVLTLVIVFLRILGLWKG